MSDDTRVTAAEEEPERSIPPPKRGADHELMVGLFVIVGLIAGVGLLYTLTDAAIFRNRYIVKTDVDDAGGIRKGDPVRMRGVNIGRILRFGLIRDHGVTKGVEVQLEIEGEYKVPKDSHVRLTSSGLLGGMVADVVPGTAEEFLHYGDKIPGDSQAAGDVIGDLTRQAQATLGRVDSLLNKQMIDDLHGATADLRVTMKDLSGTVREQRQQLTALEASMQRSANGFEQVTTTFKETATNARDASANMKALTGRPELDASMKRLDSFTAKLDEASASFQKAATSMASVAARADAGEGSLGKLSKDDALYNNLNEAAANLTKLSEDIRRNPKKYIDLKIF